MGSPYLFIASQHEGTFYDALLSCPSHRNCCWTTRFYRAGRCKLARLHKPKSFFGHLVLFYDSVWTAGIFSILVIIELVTDQLPKTPSRKVPMQFIPRLLSGGFCGAVLGAPSGNSIGCAAVGTVGAVIGTFGGFDFRLRLTKLFGGKDSPAAISEDLTAVAIAAVAVVTMWA